MRITFYCPLDSEDDPDEPCERELHATITGPIPDTPSDPGMGLGIEDLEGPCLHARLAEEGELGLDDLRLIEQVALDQARFDAEAAYDREMDSRIDREREERYT